ncbi:MAG: response regulator [Chloroflexi bacterium]|nr:response regulator [Chloroflexota bacterium]
MIDWQDINSWQVLVVDDEPDNLEVVAETLEYLGAQVKTAQNGQEALEALEAFMANLILTDLSMPVMDGWQMRANAKRNPAFAEVPIMALSAHAIVGDRERAIEAGFNGYITKPVNINTLLDDIRAALVVPETKVVEDKAI